MKSMTETIEWHRADEVLPDADTTVMVIHGGDVDAWPGYYDGIHWFCADGFRLADVLFWADMLEGPAGVERCADLEAASPALAEAQEAADFNFEQYQDAAAEMFKLAEDQEILLAALERLARLGAGDKYGNSEGNVIAQEAIARVKGAAK